MAYHRHITTSNVEGEGITDFFSEAYRHLRGIYLALIGVRSNLKPSAREMVKQYGNQPIRKLEVVRRPLSDKVRNLMKIVGISSAPHDTLFHLFFVLTLDSARLVLEKNEDLNIVVYHFNSLDEFRSVPIPQGLTLTQLLGTAISKVPKDRLFRYDAFSNNCQRFVMDVLESNNLPVSPELRSFILQDVSNLAVPWQKKLTAFFTSLANRGKMAIEGEGRH